MRKLLTALVVLIVLFSGGLIASAYIVRTKPAATQETNTPSGDAGTQIAAEGSMTRITTTDGGAELNETVTATSSIELPMAVRGKPMTAEEIFRIGEVIRNQHDMLNRRKEELRQEATRLDLMQGDLEETKRELEGLRKQIGDAMQAGEQLLAQITERQSKLDQQRGELDPSGGAIQPTEPASQEEQVENLKKMSRWLQNMEPEAAAESLRKMIDDGKIPSAVRLLSNIEDRDVAEILAFLDPALMATLLEEFKQLKPADKKKTTRRR